MTQTVVLSPLTRIEGHLAIHLETEEDSSSGQTIIKKAQCEGEMFRGLETILHGRDPLDAQQITQRICGVCPIAHGIASVMAQEMAFGIVPTRNGRIAQNLILAAEYLHSHILHFYHLAALDFVDITAILKYNGTDPTLVNLRNWAKNALDKNLAFPGAPFLPRPETDQYIKTDEANWRLIDSYVKALKIRTLAHEMAAVFGAKLPHSTSLVPTGVTGEVTIERVLACKSRLDQIKTFIHTVYLPDLFTAAAAFPQYWDIGKSHGNFLSYGVFRMEEKTGEALNNFLPSGAVIGGIYQPLDTSKIREFVEHSRYSSGSGLHPWQGTTQPEPQKGYSWIKAPRYDGQVMEVGPAARLMVLCLGPGNPEMKQDVQNALNAAGVPLEKINSVLGRHLARGLEAKWIADQCERWLDELEIGKPAAAEFALPEQGRGVGLTEAPRGALGHWLTIRNYKIERYQCIVPTTWNCSPRDNQGRPGAVEKALEGTVLQNPAEPIEAGRIVRSFDPCIACAVH
ncbi:MAG: nickel-dependent hydrogenase large subunit [Anaerohalosphaeraceae bacterium]